jgi:hypothetical protein
MPNERISPMNRLTAEIYEQIVASLRSDRSPRAHEKRHRPRVGLRSSLEIFPCPNGAKLPTATVVWVRDVSSDGLGLVSPRAFPLDMDFVAEFDRWERERLRVQYRIAYCKVLSRGLYSVGAKLVKVMPEWQRFPAPMKVI